MEEANVNEYGKGAFTLVRTLVGKDGKPRVTGFLRNVLGSWKDFEQDRVCRKAWRLEVGEEAENSWQTLELIQARLA